MKNSDEIRERLSQKGFLIEDYNKETDEFFKKVTEKGKKEIREILKDPEYQRLFKNMIKDELRRTKPEFRHQRLKRIMESL